MPKRTREATIELSAELLLLELDPGALALYGLEEQAVRGRALDQVLLTDSGPIDWTGHWASVLGGSHSSA